jgi:hypothetical protein
MTGFDSPVRLEAENVNFTEMYSARFWISL